jgi:periplasmic protein TonB
MNRHEIRRLDALAGELIRRAARNTPPSLSQRLEEEWLADLATRRGQITRLRLAAGCWWAARVIAQQHALARLAPAGSCGEHHIAAVYAPHDSSLPSRRTVALLLIASLHAGLIYLLAIGFVHKVVEAPPPVIDARVTSDTPTRKPPPPPPVRLASTRIDLPPRDFPVEFTEETNAITPTPTERPNEGPTQPPPALVRVPGGPAKGFPNTADYYPDASRRLGEKGVALVQVCVDSQGRLTANPTIAQSSGSARLDGGALTLAKAGSGHYRATTEDGKAVPSCFPFRIRFDFSD